MPDASPECCRRSLLDQRPLLLRILVTSITDFGIDKCRYDHPGAVRSGDSGATNPPENRFGIFGRGTSSNEGTFHVVPVIMFLSYLQCMEMFPVSSVAVEFFAFAGLLSCHLEWSLASNLNSPCSSAA